MFISKTQEFAYLQARIRAKLGRMPSSREWRMFASCASTAGLLQEMLASGLAFWVNGLADDASATTVERHMQHRVRCLVRDVSVLLPPSWNGFSRRLQLAPDLFWLQPLLDGRQPGLILDKDSALHSVARTKVSERRGMLAGGPFSDLFAEDMRPELVWLDQMFNYVPVNGRREVWVVNRIVKLLHGYIQDKHRLINKINQPAIALGPEAEHETRLGWLRHDELGVQLRALLAGDPFHAAMVLIYGLLELLNMEKVRALVLASVLGWPAPGLPVRGG